MTRIISGAVLTVVVGFSLGFSYLLYQIASELSAMSNFGGSASLMYLAVEGIFLVLIVDTAYAIVRKRA